MEYHGKTFEIKIIRLVIQALPVRKMFLGNDFVPLRKMTLQHVSCKFIGMVHGQVEMGKRKGQSEERQWTRDGKGNSEIRGDQRAVMRL